MFLILILLCQREKEKAQKDSHSLHLVPKGTEAPFPLKHCQTSDFARRIRHTVLVTIGLAGCKSLGRQAELDREVILVTVGALNTETSPTLPLLNGRFLSLTC